MHRILLSASTLILLLIAGVIGTRVQRVNPPPTVNYEPMADAPGPRERVMLGAGCFWGVESKLAAVEGVRRTRTGYAGGHTEAPTYEEVCSHTTGHAEVVEVEYDPTVVSLADLLKVFWSLHDPTVPRKVGPEEGGQYRSAIFCSTPEQVAVAEGSARELAKSGKYPRPVITEIGTGRNFYPAEEYHQKYYLKQGMAASCRLP